MAGCAASSYWPAASSWQPQRGTEVGEELGLDGADREPLVVAAPVRGVAGVATREDVVARSDVAAQGQLLVDGERHEPQHAVGDGDVEVGALPGGRPAGQRGGDGQRGVHAAGSGVGDGGTRKWRCAVGPGVAHGEEAADGQVVEVVTGPLRVRAVLAVAARRAVHDAAVARRHSLVADAQAVDDAGAEALDDDVGRGGQREEGRRVRRRPSGRTRTRRMPRWPL